ncbi:pca regulon regulatory protein [Arthrobacter sp. Hiyo8]|uniref:IclR family transcriptional regulator n=1 Tax=Arthrobacter sp. Hiyo1 TaxID=1588020 RepID=UPI0006839B51|nr:IclR family transcriptional regulator [Arthrobacter sp. Hiyo1]BAS11999.1 pca regulon regulatory protein [Arthrobacter sp. Hiyo8]
MTTEEPPAAVKSADRVLDVFELLADAEQGLTHTEIAASLGIPKGSLTKLLKTLVAREYLSFDELRRTHTLGPSVRMLSDRPAHVLRLIDTATPHLLALTLAINESSALNRLNGRSAEVIATATSSHRLVSHLRNGDLAPLYAVSGGKAILADMPQDKLSRYLATTRFEPVTSHTILSPNGVLAELETIRQLGIAYSREEYTPGIIGIGISLDLPPVYPKCSLNFAIPAVRVTESLQDQAIKALKDAKAVIEAQVSSAELFV